MKRLIIASILFVGFFATSCITKATEEECKKMCENLVILREDVDMSTAEERIAKVEESFKREEKRLNDWLKRDLQAWDDEVKVSLEELRDEKKKKALIEEYEKKKETTKEKHQPGIDELKPKKEAAIKEAKKKAEASKQAYKKEVDECIAGALKEGVAQKVATCRISAKTKDAYWNTCR
ncbi:MAG: hypothetical protein GY847_21620 [Proteobacteria bacterium]|nr:hypothetical protein [Pseudomonadota bacterium]